MNEIMAHLAQGEEDESRIDDGDQHATPGRTATSPKFKMSQLG